MAQRYCKKCTRMLKDSEFYATHRTDKYPDGKLDTCKQCLTMHVDNWDPETYKWILEEVDVPYVKKEWDKALQKVVDKTAPEKINGTSVLGRYLSVMKLNQYKTKRWIDTELMIEKQRQEQITTMRAQGFSGEEIDEALNSAIDYTPEKPEIKITPSDEIEADFISNEDNEFIDEVSGQLTDEEKTMLRSKWGRGYRADEWLRLESLYNDMMRSYDIQGAGMRDTLVMICKASVKANQMIDAGDIDGFQKMTKVYNELMKSAKLTAAQIKDTDQDSIDSVGELVAMCEREGFIPRYYVDGPQDHADRVLQDMQSYTQTLVTEELNLGTLFESAMRDIEADRAKEAIINTDDYDSTDEDRFAESLFAEENPVTDSLEEYDEFQELLSEGSDDE